MVHSHGSSLVLLSAQSTAGLAAQGLGSRFLLSAGFIPTCGPSLWCCVGLPHDMVLLGQLDFLRSGGLPKAQKSRSFMTS